MNNKVLYTALVLDAASHKALLAWFERVSGAPLLEKRFAHHMTLQWKPTEDQLAATEIGSDAAVVVTGWAADAQTQAVVVLTGLEVASELPHVTVACAQGTSPVRSLELLLRGHHSVVDGVKVNGPTLTGRIEAVMSK